MNAMSSLVGKVASYFKGSTEDDESKKETEDGFLSLMKDKLNTCIRDYSLSPAVQKKNEKTPNFMKVSVREKMATSRYYKGNLHEILPEKTSFFGRVRDVFRSKSSVKAKRNEEKIRIKTYFSQKYGNEKLYKFDSIE